MGEDVRVDEDERRARSTPGPARRTQRSRRVLARHARRMRSLRALYTPPSPSSWAPRWWRVAVAYRHGEISHASLHTVASAPPSVAAGHAAVQRDPAWRSTDRAAIGTPYCGGTVVTFDRHTVRGRDARTGAPNWSYTRTDRTVCTAMQDDGMTIAVYRLARQLRRADRAGLRHRRPALDPHAGRGHRRFNGPARFAVRAVTFFFVSASSLYAIDPARASTAGRSTTRGAASTARCSGRPAR